MTQRLLFIISILLLTDAYSTYSTATYSTYDTLPTNDDSLTKNINYLLDKGYITADQNSLKSNDTINWGPKFNYFIAKNQDSLSEKQAVYPIHDWNKFQNKTIKDLLNRGYPFTSLRINEVIPQNDTLIITYKVDKGKQVSIDTLIIEGNLEIESYFLNKYLNFESGNFYNYDIQQEAYKKIQRLPFAEWHGLPEVNFTIGQNEWKLPINKRKVNTIDGIIGLQSSEETQSGIKITADVQLHLWNVLGMAEELELNYKNLEAQSPQLYIAANLPYLAGLDFGPEVSFDLNIKDSAYQKHTLIVGLRYYLSYMNYIRMGYISEQSNIITPILQDFGNLNGLPEINNFKNKGIILGTKIQLTNDYWVPTKGWDINGDIHFLKKNMTPHQSYLEEADRLGIPLRDWYEEAEKEKYFWTGHLTLKKYSTLFQSIYLFNKIEVGHKQISSPSLNELYRIGGQQTLRGFDDLRFYTKSYSVFTIEPRMLINQRSFLFLFSDLGWLKEKSTLTFQDTFAWGIGAGLSLFTDSGLFNVAFGVGKIFPDNFDFKRPQVHIGYKAIF